MRSKRNIITKAIGAISIVICLVMINIIPAQALGMLHVIINNHGEIMPPVMDEQLLRMGVISEDQYYGREGSTLNNDTDQATLARDSVLVIDWEGSVLSKYEGQYPYATDFKIYEYSASSDSGDMTFYTDDIPMMSSRLPYSKIVTKKDTDMVQIVFDYVGMDEDGDTYDGWCTCFYVVEKDNYNLAFKDTGLNPDGTIYEGLTGTMYRMYNPNSGEHFYTANIKEANQLLSLGWNYEKYAWTAPTSSSVPVYRLYNRNGGYHHYTTSSLEKKTLVDLGWVDEGIAWYSDENKTTPLYRLYNPNATGEQEAGGHHYTKDETERKALIAAGWRDEGIGWYGL